MADPDVKVPVRADLIAAVEEVCAAVDALDAAGGDTMLEAREAVLDAAFKLRDVARRQ